MAAQQTIPLSGNRIANASRKWRRRRGAVLVVFAIFLIVLLAMLGLVIDWALMASTYRQAQNAADAAALAAARDLIIGRSIGDSTATATTFVQDYNGLPDAAPTVNSPPKTGLYAGKDGYVEVVVTVPLKTLIVHIAGVTRDQQVEARAVAGYEARSAGEGIAVLDPDARPGIDVSGGGTVLVRGTVTVNSEGGGVDENNQSIDNGNGGFAARGGQPNSSAGVFAEDIQVVGGVDDPANFKPVNPADPSPLHCGSLPGIDALQFLPTPMVSTGVDSRRRGAVAIANVNVKGINSDTAGQNFVAVGGETVGGGHVAAAGEVILHPGIYDSITVTGGSVYLIPGIYVLSPPRNITNSLQITGGTINAQNVLFYNTASSYNSADGTPDANDGDDPSPLGNTEFVGGFAINSDVTFSPIDTSRVNYASLYSGAPAVSPKFDGMLFFQRRRNRAGLSVQGNSSRGSLAGTLYAKRAIFSISGQGTYDAQIVCGSLATTGGGTITILSGGVIRGSAFQIYLVE